MRLFKTQTWVLSSAVCRCTAALEADPLRETRRTSHERAETRLLLEPPTQVQERHVAVRLHAEDILQ